MSCPRCLLGDSAAALEASPLPSGADLFTCPCGMVYSSTLSWAVDHPDRTSAKWRRAARRAMERRQGRVRPAKPAKSTPSAS